MINRHARRAFLAILRRDFPSFVAKVFATLDPGIAYEENWHVFVLAEALRRVFAGDTKRLIINVPPRSGKSTIVTIAFAAFILGHDPRKRIITVSYSDDLAKAHTAAFRAVVNSVWYRELFPRFAIQRGGDRDTETVTTERGFRYATSLAGSVMGRGADIIIGDDVMSPEAALSEAVRVRETNRWMTAHRTRLNHKRDGAIVLVMQRLHEQDLVGHVLDSEEWERLVIPAIAPEPAEYATGPSAGDIYRRPEGEVLHPTREPLEVLDATRRAIGSMAFSAQYQQEPIPPGGNAIQRSWLRFYDEPPEMFDFKLVSWDTASTVQETSAWSAGTVWGAVGMEFYLLAVNRQRLEAPALRRAIVDMNETWRVDATLIENTSHGQAIAQELWASRSLRTILQSPTADKLARLLAVSPHFEAGQVFLPREAEWLGTYMKELLGFPVTQYNDQVDSTSQALRYLISRQGPREAAGRRLVRRDIVRRDIPRAYFVDRR